MLFRSRATILDSKVPVDGLRYSTQALREIARKNKKVFVYKENIIDRDRRSLIDTIGVVEHWIIQDGRLYADIDFFREAEATPDISAAMFGISRNGVVSSAQVEFLYKKKKKEENDLPSVHG